MVLEGLGLALSMKSWYACRASGRL